MTVQDSSQELWGGETTKAVANFPVSGERVPLPVVRWLGRVKGAAARANVLKEGQARVADGVRHRAAGGLGAVAAVHVHAHAELVDQRIRAHLGAWFPMRSPLSSRPLYSRALTETFT